MKVDITSYIRLGPPICITVTFRRVDSFQTNSAATHDIVMLKWLQEKLKALFQQKLSSLNFDSSVARRFPFVQTNLRTNYDVINVRTCHFDKT